MNVIKEINKLNQRELDLGLSGGASWHDEHKDSAYIHISGIADGLTDGDVITIASQFGEPLHIHMPRDPKTGKAKGFAWLMYTDQRSTVLAVDNLNGSVVVGRTLRVDHARGFRQQERDPQTGKMRDVEDEQFNAHWKDEHLRIPPKKGQPAAKAIAPPPKVATFDPDDKDLLNPMADYIKKNSFKKHRGADEAEDMSRSKKHKHREGDRDRESEKAAKLSKKAAKLFKKG